LPSTRRGRNDTPGFAGGEPRSSWPRPRASNRASRALLSRLRPRKDSSRCPPIPQPLPPEGRRKAGEVGNSALVSTSCRRFGAGTWVRRARWRNALGFGRLRRRSGGAWGARWIHFGGCETAQGAARSRWLRPTARGLRGAPSGNGRRHVPGREAQESLGPGHHGNVAAAATGSSAEQSLEVAASLRRRETARGHARSCRAAAEEGSALEGVASVRRGRHGVGTRQVSPKPGEPHGRGRDATSPSPNSGESRQGGEKPRRRNMCGIGSAAPKSARFVGWAGGRAERWSDGGAVFDVTVKVVQLPRELADREMRSRTRST
jgi:hypothetical protein